MFKHKIRLVTSLLLVALVIATGFAPTAYAADCTTTVLRYNARNDCVSQLQQYLKDYGGIWPSTLSIDGIMGRGTVNAVLNFQSAEHIQRDGIVGPATWGRLVNPQRPANPIPKICTTSTAILCASKAERRIRLFKSGNKVYDLPVRFGGMTKNDAGKYQIYATVNGTYKVYGKNVAGYSARWDAKMPYSIMFDPNMYVHYSPDFNSVGYVGASHGCINLRNITDAKTLYDATPIGATVHVY